MRDLKAKVKVIYETLESLENNDYSNLSDEEIAVREKLKFESFFKGYIIAEIITGT